MTKKAKIMVAGLGFVGGQAHVPAINRIPQAELVAVVDVNGALAEQVAQKYNTKFFTDLETAFDSCEADGVIIAVPTPYHFDLTKMAIAKGKHVLCEMPMTASAAETRELGKLAKEAGVLVLPDLNFRFTPNYVQVKALVDAGAIGKPIAIHFVETLPTRELKKQWPMSSWAWDPKKSGGFPDFTLSVWSLDLLRWLLKSDIDSVAWKSNYTPISAHKDYMGYNTMGLLKFHDGTVATLHFSCTVAKGKGGSQLTILGSNTNSIIADDNNSIELLEDNTTAKWSYTYKGTKVWGHYQIDAHFVDSILGICKPAFTIDDAIKAEEAAAQMVER